MTWAIELCIMGIIIIIVVIIILIHSVFMTLNTKQNTAGHMTVTA